MKVRCVSETSDGVPTSSASQTHNKKAATSFLDCDLWHVNLSLNRWRKSTVRLDVSQILLKRKLESQDTRPNQITSMVWVRTCERLHVIFRVSQRQRE